MKKIITDNFGFEYHTKNCSFFLCDDNETVLAYCGTYRIGKFLFDDLELTNKEIERLTKRGNLWDTTEKV